MTLEELRGKCRHCNWAKFSWCSDGKRVSNEGNCLDWKLDKISDASRKKQAAIQKAAHVRDMAKRGKK
jgi:hypothetical protein